MPALPPYIPNKQLALDAWLLNFSTLITASPATYGLSPTDASNIAGYYATWHAAFTLVTSPSTRTADVVGAKNAAKVTVLGQVRPYAQTISLNPGVTSGDKIALGLNPRTSTPSPITPPASNPILNVQSAANLSIIMRYRDSAASPSVKAKPYGVTACRIFGATSATVISDPTTLPFKVNATKSPLTLTFSSSDAGKTAYFAAQWAIRTGGVSPWSPIISFTVPQGA